MERWPDYTVEPVCSGHPSGPNQLAAIERWPDYTVEPVYSGQPTAIERWQWNLSTAATNQLAARQCYGAEINLLLAEVFWPVATLAGSGLFSVIVTTVMVNHAPGDDYTKWSQHVDVYFNGLGPGSILHNI
jgi:hypothetical protein